MAQSAEGAKIILQDSKSYSEWITALQTQATTSEVWHLFDPQRTDMPLVAPVSPEPPLLSQFVQAGEPEPPGPHALSPAMRKIWDSQIEYYKICADSARTKIAAHRDQRRAIQQVVNYIQQTVSSHIFSTCCLPTKTYHQWIAAITKSVGIDKQEVRNRARAEYKWLLHQGAPKKLTQWDIWLQKYHEAATNAEVHGCLELKDLEAVLEEFKNAVRSVDPLWIESIRQASKGRTLTREEIMEDWRNFMENHHPVKTNTKSAFAAAGDLSINAIEGDAFHVENSSSVYPQDRLGKSSSKPGQGTATLNPGQKRQGKIVSRKQTPGKIVSQKRSFTAPPSTECSACSMRHNLQDCYYLFPDLAPDSWAPRESLKKMIQVNIDHNPEIQEQIRAAKRIRSNTTHIKKSQSAAPEVQED
jgi:hypothetical protein